MSVVAAAVRRGLCTQIPLVALKLMRWDELERRVCGNPVVDLDLLQTASEYEGYSSSDPVVKWFWEIMTEFTLEQRKVGWLQF